MTINKELLENYFSDPNHLFLLWGVNDTCVVDNEYFSLDYLSFFIPVTGSVDIQTDMHVIHGEPLHIQFFIHNNSAKIINISEDYTSVGIIFSKKYWNHTLIHTHPALTLSTFNPSLALTEQQIKTLGRFYTVIKQLKQQGYSDNDPVIINLILGLFFFLGRFYEKWSLSIPKNSDNKVVAKFASLLFQNFRVHRDVEFYAKKLHLSNSQFSNIVKSTTNMTPYQCIEHYTLLKLCTILKNTDRSIKEIAFDFNFNDTSHLCKFFKKRVGQSPLEFRKKYFFKEQDVVDSTQDM